MQIKALFLLSFALLAPFAQAQVRDSLTIELDTLSIAQKQYENADLINSSVLETVFNKLEQIEKNKQGKVRIVHVGDSHIQAEFLTNSARNNLQAKFGNAGLGFVFPHKLARTNGLSAVRFQSNTIFNSYRTIRPISNEPVGVSGFSLSTSNKNSAIEVLIKDANYQTNILKIITPDHKPNFELAFSAKVINLQGAVSKKTTIHKIKSGETLSQISRKYNVSVQQLKKANQLKDANIRAGKVLKIPNQVVAEKSNFDHSQFTFQKLVNEKNSFNFESTAAFNKFYLLPNPAENTYALSGLVLEKKDAGVTYSGIGVNGARFSDYNKYDRFFSEMQALEADIVVVSFGTNESFDKLPAEEYMKTFLKFKENLTKYNPNAIIIATTPPPSSLYKKYLNTYAQDYANALVTYALSEKDIAVWNMYYVFGGLHGVNENLANGLMAKDRVHYSKSGYEQQGKLFSDALIKAYESFILNK